MEEIRQRCPPNIKVASPRAPPPSARELFSCMSLEKKRQPSRWRRWQSPCTHDLAPRPAPSPRQPPARRRIPCTCPRRSTILIPSEAHPHQATIPNARAPSSVYFYVASPLRKVRRLAPPLPRRPNTRSPLPSKTRSLLYVRCLTCLQNRRRWGFLTFSPCTPRMKSRNSRIS